MNALKTDEYPAELPHVTIQIIEE